MKENNMNYDEFCEYVKDHIKEYLPEKYQDHITQIVKNSKVNYDAKSLIIRNPKENCCPSIPMETFFEHYQEGWGTDVLLNNIAEVQIAADRDIDKVRYGKMFAGGLDLRAYSEQIVVKAIGYERNEALLADIPHRVMGDIALCYQVILSSNDETVHTILINDQMLVAAGVNEAWLHSNAINNAVKAMPAECTSLDKMLEQIIGESTQELFGNQKESEKRKTGIYVLTNKQKFCGAATIFYPDIMEHLQKMFKDGFYILPSSLHEVLIVPKKQELAVNDFSKMVREINQDYVEKQDILSDYVHEYDSHSRQIVIAPGQDISERVQKANKGLQHDKKNERKF